MKKMEDLKIVFMGTPEFAVASLEALVKAGCHIAGVVTAPDKPAGRGMQLQQSAVKKYAVEHNIPVLQPEKLKNNDFLEQLKSLNADLQIVVAFRMLPEVVWNMPPMGSINLHGSLLPQYRGAAPINWAVINGEQSTGVTTFKLKHAIDTGDILLQESFPIEKNETAGEVHDKMKEIGARVLLKTILGLANETLIEKPQDSMGIIKSGNIDPEQGIAINCDLKHAPKIFTETCKINFNNTVAQVHNLIRGLSPFPGAFTYLNGKMLKIYKSAPECKFPNASDHHPKLEEIEAIQSGEFLTDGKTFLKFACADGFIQVKELQQEGKKRMQVEDFLKGFRA